MNVGALDLNLLVVFDALLTEGSVTQAAERVGLSQPAFSHALGRLRAGIGDPLFERTGRGMAPTARAQAMAGPVRAALEDLARALAPRAVVEPSRPVSVATNEYSRLLVMPDVVKALARRAPAVRLDIRRCAAMDDARQADLAIYWVHPRTSTPGTVILRDRMVGTARAANRAVGSAVSETALDQLQIVDVDDERSGRSVGRARSDGACHTVPDALTALALASRSDAVAILPNRLARRFAANFGLKIFKLPGHPPNLALELTWSDQRAADPAVAAAKRCIIEAARGWKR
jgi:DNA-binding transcriptional LysR family regulator